MCLVKANKAKRKNTAAKISALPTMPATASVKYKKIGLMFLFYAKCFMLMFYAKIFERHFSEIAQSRVFTFKECKESIQYIYI